MGVICKGIVAEYEDDYAPIPHKPDLDNLKMQRFSFNAKNEMNALIKALGVMEGYDIDDDCDEDEILSDLDLTRNDLNDFEFMKNFLDERYEDYDIKAVLSKLKIGDKVYIDKDTRKDFSDFILDLYAEDEEEL